MAFKVGDERGLPWAGAGLSNSKGGLKYRMLWAKGVGRYVHVCVCECVPMPARACNLTSLSTQSTHRADVTQDVTH